MEYGHIFLSFYKTIKIDGPDYCHIKIYQVYLLGHFADPCQPASLGLGSIVDPGP